MQYLLGRRQGSTDSVVSAGSVGGPTESTVFVATVHPGLEYISNLSPLNRTLLLLQPPGKSGSLSVDEDGGQQRGATIDAATVSRACAPHIRVAAIKQLPETCYSVGYEEAAEYIVPLVLQRLPGDPDPSIRQALLDTLGELAAFLILSDPEEGYHTLVDKLFPLVTKMLVNDKSSEVRSRAATAMATLAVHMRARDHGETVLTTLLRLSQMPADPTASGALGEDETDSSGQFNGTAATAAVQLMGQLSPTLGPDICSQYIVAQLNSLTEERSPKVRRSVAGAMAEVAAIIGPTLTLSKLYPFYLQLTHDPHWAVRKSAVDSLHLFLMELLLSNRDREASSSSSSSGPVDSAVSELLSAMSAALVTDTSWWVRKAAMLKVGYVVASCSPLLSHPSVLNAVDPLLAQFSDLIVSYASNLSQLSSRDPSTSVKGASSEGGSLGGAELSREILYHAAFTFVGVARGVSSAPIDFATLWPQRLQKPFLALLHCSESRVRRPLIASLHILVASEQCQEVFEDCALAVIQILASPQSLAEERILVLRDAVEGVFQRLGPKSALRGRMLRILTTLATSPSTATPRSRSASLSLLSSRGDGKNITVTDTTGWREKQELARVAGKLFNLWVDPEDVATKESPASEPAIGSLVALWLTLLAASTPTICLAAARSAPQLFRCRYVGRETKRRIVAYLVKKYACSEYSNRRRVLVEVAKQVLLAVRRGPDREDGDLQPEGRYFMTLLALLGLDDCVHIRQSVASTLCLLSPLPADLPESITSLVETLRQDDDDAEVKRTAERIIISSDTLPGKGLVRLDWSADTGYEYLPSPAAAGHYDKHWVLHGDDTGTTPSSPTSPGPQRSSSCSSSVSGFDGGTGSSDGASHALLEEVDEELSESLATLEKAAAVVDTVRCDTPRSVPGQAASANPARSFYIGGEDTEEEGVPDDALAEDFTLDDCREVNDNVGSSTPTGSHGYYKREYRGRIRPDRLDDGYAVPEVSGY
ncbi:hypothetical protein FOZ61_002629 [Perkinsus olseni]|uniref:Uncharacterized protein n=1 Tax=Perkinsus olseni TaxID=32597 RepID=A0A7J6LSR2_PEROL|nr:hypothetical protein FOZ61_002629 [Perkinsus olseni]